MTSSETARALIFVSLALLGCLIRTYIRTANGEKEDEVHFWSSRFSEVQKEHATPFSEKVSGFNPQTHRHGSDSQRPRSTNTSSGEVSQAVSVMHDQLPRFAPFLAELPTSQERPPAPGTGPTTSALDGSEVDEAYEDWAAMHHARGAVSEDADASIDNLLQRRQLHKSMNLQVLPHLESLDASGASTPSIWTAHFPAAQLRPY